MTAPRVFEADVVIVGSGITAAMVAAKLAEETTASVLVLEAGGSSVPLRERALAFVRRAPAPVTTATPVGNRPSVRRKRV